jgi:hypothetical protein
MGPWLYRKEHKQQEMCSQRLASRRLMPIRAAIEATNLMVPL